MHELDNPAWHALAGPQSTLGDPRNGPLARRYDPEVAPFAALPDEPDAAAWDALRDLVGPANTAVLFRAPVRLPDRWTSIGGGAAPQMIPGTEVPAPDVDLVPLGPADVREMLALVERTQPGPFATRTVELGTYLGVRADGRLVAMAGERMRPAGASEISAVCVDADHRRRGLAAALVQALVDEIRGREEQPFLHLAADNEVALRTYEALGFTIRRLVDVTVLTAPP